MASALGWEGLADTSGPHQQDAFLLGRELQREDGVQQSAIQGEGRRPIEVLQPACFLQASGPDSQLQAPVGLEADLVEEDVYQEGGVVDWFPRAGPATSSMSTMEFGAGILTNSSGC